ncbi:MAG: hypothetical protein ACRD4R_09165 [Candidatus Acidiferrales bacterium]
MGTCIRRQRDIGGIAIAEPEMEVDFAFAAGSAPGAGEPDFEREATAV